MKRIKDCMLLAGKTETMTCMEFRSAPGDALSKAEMGMILTITRNGKPICVLSKYDSMGGELVILPSGEIVGGKPLTMGEELDGTY